MHKKLTWLSAAAILLFIFIYMLIINYAFPRSSDDFKYALDFVGIANPVKLVLTSVHHYYLTWSGRLSVNIISYSLLSFIPVFNIINALIFCLLIYGTFLCAFLRPIKALHDVLTLIFIFFIYWFFMPEFAEVVFWKTGAIGYLWPMTLCLFFIYPFTKLLIKDEDIISGKYIKTILLIIAALFLGTSNELLIISVSFLLLLTNFLYWLRNKKLLYWSVVTTILFLIAAVILIISPGNHVRAVTTSTHDSLFQKIHPLASTVFSHYYKFRTALPLGLLLVCAVLVLLITLTITSLSILRRQKTFLLFSIYILLTIITIITSLGGPFILFGDRTSFFADTFFIVAMVSIIANQDFLKQRNLGYEVFCLITLCFTVPSMISVYHEVVFFKQQVIKRENLVALYKKNNAPVFLQPLAANEAHEPDVYLLLYQPYLVIRDIPPPSLANWYHVQKVTMRPFVELWSNLKQAINSQQSANRFNVVVANRTIYYISTSGACDATINQNLFSLQVYLRNRFILPEDYRKNGYETFDFQLQPENRVTVISDEGREKNDVCVFAAHLPNHTISKIITRQYNIVGGEKIFTWTNTLAK